MSSASAAAKFRAPTAVRPLPPPALLSPPPHMPPAAPPTHLPGPPRCACTAGHRDVAEAARAVDVDQGLRLREPELHHRDQAVPSGQDAGLRAEPGQQRDRVRDAGGPLVLHVRRNLHAALPRATARVTSLRSCPQPGPGQELVTPRAGHTECVMTLTQLNAFVLVARLGSVTAAANALGVTQPARSQALSALPPHLGDPLVSRGPNGMTLTTGGSRLLATASQ